MATSPVFKRTMTQRENSPGVTPNCWACGGNINATDRFCSACGVPSNLYSQVTSQTSSSELPSDTAFCPKCGGKVINAQVITSTDRSQEPTTMDAGVRNHHVAGPGPIAPSTSITLERVQQSENPRVESPGRARRPISRGWSPLLNVTSPTSKPQRPEIDPRRRAGQRIH